MSNQVIVVGGGLAGLSAAHSCLQKGASVLLLDKMKFLGGNSVKATSGINGAGTSVQRKSNVPDTPETFLRDTALSASKGESDQPYELAKVLTYGSAPAVEWLIDCFGLDLSILGRLGGHSHPRTHRGTQKFPGMTITTTLLDKFEEICEKEPHRAKLMNQSRVTRLLFDEKSNRVIGVEYQRDNQTHTAHGSVILATGGYAADFSPDSLLIKHRPDLKELSTTNGEHCTGDGIKLAETIGGASVDMEYVQVHPTGLVDLKNPNSKVKFLAAEALRGAGGVLLNADGERFCDELGRRDYVSGEMNKNKGPFRLILNSGAAKEIEWHCKHYEGRGLMKFFKTGEELARDIGCSNSKLESTFNKYNEVAKNNNDPYGKKFFAHTPFKLNDSFYCAQVVPVIHYCMGGVQINGEAQVVGRTGQPILGLYATGEVCGGVHGKNRLGGSSLLDCVVFGRVAGETACKHLLQFSESSGSQQPVQGGAQQPFSATLQVNPSAKNVQMTLSWNGNSSTPQTNAQGGSTSSIGGIPTNAVGPAPIEGGSGNPDSKVIKEAEKKSYSADEVAKHTSSNDMWIIVDGQVLDVSRFADEHPGGRAVLELYAGKDATEEFNMVHEKSVISKYAPEIVIGTVGSGGSSKPATTAAAAAPISNNTTSSSGQVVGTNFDQPNNPVSLSPIQKLVPSNKKSKNSGGTADILPNERKKVSFNVNKLTNVLDGGEEGTKRRKFIISPIRNSDNSDKYHLDRHQQLAQHIKHFIEVHKRFPNYIPTREETIIMSINSTISGSLMNHLGLFLPTVMGMASDEQKAEWAPRILSFRMIGCYAQTELGHGSNVRGLETTATYDKETQEFIIDSPTLTSAKFWPGTLGKVANCAAVYAQLIIDGKQYGVHVFLVWLRDENHRPLPGIELGDLGEKLGDDANDTGFARFHNVRIPRTNMFMGYQHVTSEGKYIISEKKKKNPRAHYATMMLTRGGMVRSAGGALSKGVTVASRYSLVRRQGFANTQTSDYQSEERPIIDYQMQRYRVLKQLSIAYAMNFTGRWMLDQFKKLEGEKASAVIGDTSALPEIAATSAGLKAVCTKLASDGLEDCRKCCGGNGYLLSSGIGALSVDYLWQTTAEGDFIILMLQTARFLVKSLQKVMKGEPVSGPADYLNVLKSKNFDLKSAAPKPPKSSSQLRNLDYLLEAFRFRALYGVVIASEELQKRLKSGLSYDEAWSQTGVSLCDAVKGHCYLFLLQNFVHIINGVDDAQIKKVLTDVCCLFGVTNMLDEQWYGLVDWHSQPKVRSTLQQLLDAIRPDLIGLVDAFDFPDNVLNSTIGRHDGNVYEALFESALKSTLNTRDPFDGFENMKKFIDMEFLKQGIQSQRAKM